MSNTNEIGIGLVTVKNITPTFKAVFDPLIERLNLENDRIGEVFEFVILQDDSVGKNCYRYESEVCKSLKDLLHDYPVDDVGINEVLASLAKQNGASEENIVKLSEGLLSDDPLSLEDLYSIVDLADPEAEIQSVMLESAFVCDKQILGEFGGYFDGGYFEYYSKNYSLNESTCDSASMALAIDSAIKNDEPAKASKAIEQRVLNLFDGIEDDDIRKDLIHRTFTSILYKLNKEDEKDEAAPARPKPRG
ncbi:hypothetical protein [Ferrovum sp.]|uniref:hypothetical protein n=1 Tax=Ferrovum sp. TaxID=2609467 RepID=UPI00262EC6B2|nr:hypothetical protein [Ferrovum sp.]